MKVKRLTRYPIKGAGREALRSVVLEADRPMPGDRAWAIAHERGAGESGSWRPCSEFLTVSSGPGLAPITAESDGDAVTLQHPAQPRTRFELPADSDALVDWVRPLWRAGRPEPKRVVRAPLSTGMSDNGIASVSILTEASLAALSDAAGQAVEAERFRGNIVLDGGAPWEEFSWVGRRLRIGGAMVEVVEPIERCRATEASTSTGERDINTLSILRDAFGHRDFGVYARIVSGGTVALEDVAEVAANGARPAEVPRS